MSDMLENKKVDAVRSLFVTKSAFTLVVSTPEEDIMDRIRKLADKMQKTLDYCRSVVISRTPYIITQEKVLVEMLDGNTGE